MSLNDVADSKNPEIDKSKPHNTNDDTIATASMNNGVCDAVKFKMQSTIESSKKPVDLCLQSSSHLISSITSSLADTPGDSGVLCLDSEASEGTSHALMTHSLVGAEELTCDSQCDVATISSQDLSKSTSSSLMTRSDIDNQNMSMVDEIVPELLVEHKSSPVYENLPDVVLKALESETKVEQKSSPRSCEPKKSLSEDIVFRRRCRKKSQSGPSSQKKRVSFHEDILNSTRTDNIHIERGFVSYGPDPAYCDRFKMRNNIVADRSSWCASGDRTPKFAADVAQQTMSDILTYGDSDTTRSGVFEYCQDTEAIDNNKGKDNFANQPKKKLYGCDSNSSDSNFSCESESSSSDSTSSNSNKTPSPVQRKCDTTQKSYSCDGFGNDSHMTFMRKTYFSEADIDQPHDRLNKPLEVTQNTDTVKSVLKKNRYINTNVVEERKNNKKVLKILQTNNIIDSLKSFYKNFNFNLAPEKGLPETSMELSNVVEALPDLNQNKKLCKSLDSGFQIDDEDDFVEINLNEQTIDLNKPKEPKIFIDPKEGSPRHKLTLNMKPNKPTGNNNEVLAPINKYVVNCESTVYEHKGVSYSYVHDTFQTEFDAPKQTFVPLPEAVDESQVSTDNSDGPKPMDVDNSSKSSTPRRYFNKSLQDETDLKNGIPKHLSSPKKQNVSRFNRRSFLGRSNDDNSDNCSNTDNSTLKGGEELNDVLLDSPSNQKCMSNKSVLLNRYLKNVYQKKDLELKIRNNKFFQNKLRLEKGFPSIIYPMHKVCETFHTSAQRMSRLIDKEVIENKRLSVRLLTANEPSYFDSFEDDVAIECSEKLRLQIFSYPKETLNRMLKVQSPYNIEDGSWIPLLVFITDYALYVASVEVGATEYKLLCRLPHDELDAIAIGPDNQYVQVIDISGNIACSVVTAESSLGARLASSLEWSARTSPLRPRRPPAVIPLSMRPAITTVASLTFEKQLPQVLFYGSACSGETGDRMMTSPGTFAPPLEGYLMYKADAKRKFEPCYFLLRAGVLQWGPQSPTSGTSLPHSIALRTAVGVRRREDSSRPHCFEIALCDSRRLLLAAPDDTAASNWLQSLLLHAAQALEENCTVVPSPMSTTSGPPPPACTVIVTRGEVISVRHALLPAFVVGAAPYLKHCGHGLLLREYLDEMRTDVDILACGSIKNLTAFKIPDSDENWCCLEWSVFEARERGAGLSLVFASSTELERFIAAVETAYCALTSEAFPLSVIDGTKSTCEAAHTKYEAAWAHMLPTQH